MRDGKAETMGREWWSRLSGYWRRLTSRRARRAAERERLRALISLVNDQSQPNLNALMIVARDITPLALNVKQLGYDLARRLAAALPPVARSEAQKIALECKASTQADMQSEWVAHWCGELAIPVIFHRKMWELAYVLQALFQGDRLRAGMRGLGFGCGTEPIPSYLASRGIAVTVTDLPEAQSREFGWSATNQRADSRALLFHPHLVDRGTFDRLVDLRYVDMNDIPADLRDYDFCWSVCALEHVGSIARGLAFIEKAMATLRPGGVAVHTTELNIHADGPTIDNWPTVLFQRRHFEDIAARLAAKGHSVAPLNFDLGALPMDRFIDVPPFEHELTPDLNAWLGPPAHLKVSIDGFASTCFGLAITKAGGAA